MTRRHPRRTRTIWIASTVVLALVAGVAAWYFRPWEAWATQEPAVEETSAEPVTAPVELATLTSRVRLSGQLSYGDAAPLPTAAGTITVLPVAGQVVETGQRVYEADGAPVVLFRGERPFWRDLSVDSSDGEDVRQLEQNLQSLGFFSGEPDARFDWVTRQAVRDWQKSLGLEQSGAFSPASVVVASSSGVRISQLTARLGDSGASPATYTETTLRATAKLTEAQARELAVGTSVAVSLPDGTEIDTVLSAIDPGGAPTGDEGKTTSPSATVEFPDQSQVAEAGAVAVRITIQGDAEETPTLVVPATSLVATADGGYAVDVYRDGTIIRTPVTIGLVADARVQVLASGTDIDGGSGPVLAENDLVVLAR